MSTALGHVEIMSDRAQFLAGRDRNVTSQYGEDGLIETLFEQIGVANRWCFEVGASDGEFYSNTKRLRDDGWSAVLIEADAKRYEELQKLDSYEVLTVHEAVGRNSLDCILGRLGAPKDLDLGVIDIDGQDYWVWEGMKLFRPRVMLVEFDYRGEELEFIPELGRSGQAGMPPLIRLGESKGYTALARTPCNVLFVREELL